MSSDQPGAKIGKKCRVSDGFGVQERASILVIVSQNNTMKPLFADLLRPKDADGETIVWHCLVSLVFLWFDSTSAACSGVCPHDFQKDVWRHDIGISRLSELLEDFAQSVASTNLSKDQENTQGWQRSCAEDSRLGWETFTGIKWCGKSSQTCRFQWNTVMEKPIGLYFAKHPYNEVLKEARRRGQNLTKDPSSAHRLVYVLLMWFQYVLYNRKQFGCQVRMLSMVHFRFGCWYLITWLRVWGFIRELYGIILFQRLAQWLSYVS